MGLSSPIKGNSHLGCRSKGRKYLFHCVYVGISIISNLFRREKDFFDAVKRSGGVDEVKATKQHCLPLFTTLSLLTLQSITTTTTSP